MNDERNFAGKKVTVIGLGIEGDDLARYFLRRGAIVTVSDMRDRAALGARAADIEALGARLSLGGNDPADTISADLVCPSQGVPLTIPAVIEAQKAAVAVTSMTRLFLEEWAGPVAGITGSSGKTTTTSLVDAMFTAGGREHVLGGNIGIGLTSLLDESSASDLEKGGRWAVLEISHTQLTLVDRSPRVAALLNVTANHLDQFSWEEYVGLKTKIFAFQGPGDSVVLNLDDPVSRELRPTAKGRVFLFSTRGDPKADGGFVSGDRLYWRRDGRTEPVVATSEIGLRGAHNIANVAAAVAIAAACEIEAAAAREAVLQFRAPPHRIELVGCDGGINYFDDSIATTPERTLAALRSFEESVVLLLGGRDKKLPLQDLVSEIGRRCRAVICFGEAGPLFGAAVSGQGVPVEVAGSLEEAVAAAREKARAGDVVLLSPAGTSFDAYANFERRGEHFRALVGGAVLERDR